MPRPVSALLIGLAAGVIGGLFGVGGGIVVVPALVLVLGFTQHLASGTSTATIMASSAAALAAFAAEGSVDWAAAGVVAIGGAVGATAGARYLDRVPERWLTRAFTAVMMVAAIRLAFG